MGRTYNPPREMLAPLPLAAIVEVAAHEHKRLRRRQEPVRDGPKETVLLVDRAIWVVVKVDDSQAPLGTRHSERMSSTSQYRSMMKMMKSLSKYRIDENNTAPLSPRQERPEARKTAHL